MTKRPTILVVDDEAAIRGLLVEFLRGEGYAVIAAPNGRLAVRAARTQHPDLIIMDMMMPELDGREAVRQLRVTPELTTVPIVLMSAGLRSTAGLDGIAGFVPKPFDLDYLLSLVRRTLADREGT